MEKKPRFIVVRTRFKASKNKKEKWYMAFTAGKLITPNNDLWDGDEGVIFSEFINYRIRSHYLALSGVWHCELMDDYGNIIDVDSSPDGLLTYFLIVNE